MRVPLWYDGGAVARSGIPGAQRPPQWGDGKTVGGRAFRPRGAMAAWLVIMAVVIVLGSMGGAVHARERAPFDDVPPRTWPYAVIDHFAERGWVTHYPGDLFASHRTLTRYEMALATRDIVEHAGASASWTLSP